VPPLVDVQEAKWSENTAELPAFDGISCIYAGTPSGKDQVLFLLEALKTALEKGARVRLIFLGDELEPIRNAMLSPRLISCRNNIVFAGKVQQHQVPAYYKTADFSLLFREHNRKNDAGFPTKFVESMAAGVPVIGNLTSDIGNYLLDGHNGFVLDSVHADMLADLFVRLNDLTEQQLVALKKAARTTAVQHFDYRIHQEKLNQFIHSTR
jgi:glycosyltransferase involved in cell wall biosynthesis